MIIVCGVKSEQPIALLLSALRRKGVDYLLINQSDLFRSIRLRWKLSQDGISGKIKVGPEVVDVKEIRSVYQRFMSIDQIPVPPNKPEYIGHTRSVLLSLIDLFDIIPARIVNRRRSMMSNNSKPYQSILIRKAGFSIPDTLITNVPDEANDYVDKHTHVIYKSISAIRSTVKKVDNEDKERFKNLVFLPTQFQKMISGDNVRVHVVGDKVFATKINTTVIDYRYAHIENENPEFEVYQLSPQLEKMCVDLTENLGLLFSGIDLIITNKETYCLEVNTSPAYSYYQQRTGQPISEALADLLST